MKIGIDCRTILNPESGERAGVGHYTYQLVKALIRDHRQHQFFLYFDYRMAREGTQEFMQDNITIRYLPFSSYGKFLPVAYSQMLVAAAMLRDRLDVFHAPANVIPLSYRRPSVVTVHDLAIYRHPEWFPKQMFSTRVLVPRSLRRAKHIIAVSRHTKMDIVEMFKIPAEKITVIHEAVDVNPLPLQDVEDDVREKYGLPDRFVLFVGTVEPRKNITVLLSAWKKYLESEKSDQEVKLVIAGGLGFQGDKIIKTIADLELGSSVRHLNYVPHNHKIKLMMEASVFVFPSLYEGFGLPVLEAMTLGTPVITTNTSSLTEVAGQAAIIVEPNDASAIAQAIEQIITQPALAADLTVRGRKQAASFSWDQAAAATLAVYKMAAKA